MDRNEETVFEAALQYRDPAERRAFVTRACGADARLQADVEALLQAHDSQSLLDAPVLESGPLYNTPQLLEGPRTIIGRYKLLEKIGEGGMAVVYMAEQTEPIRRKVALKIIKLGMDTRQVIARFEAERQALALMDHPSIAKVLDAGATEAGRPYFVMELVTGVSITEYCDKNRLSTKERLALFLQVCRAVQHAHQKGIIHRDIKPSNVMVTHHDGKPVPKVIDFGIAKATNQRLTEKTLFTRYAHIIGTPAYMSPEQAELSDLDIDTRSDVYSLGVLLYELLTGTTPFSEEELRKAGYIEMQRVIREQEPVKPSTKLSTLGETLTDIAKRRNSTPEVLRKAVRGDLDWIVMKSLEKDRARRYETANGLAEDVRRHLEHEPILARGPSTAYRLGKFLRRHRWQTIAALAVIVIAGAAVVVLLLWSRDRLQLAEAEGLRHRGVLSQARESFAAHDLATALDRINPILDSKHVGAEARLLRGGILMEGSQPEEAEHELQALLTEKPEIAGASHYLLARLYWEGGSSQATKLAKAAEHRRHAENLLPGTAEAYFLRAMTAATTTETLDMLDRALAQDPSHYESLRWRAYINYASKRFQDVEKDARVMVALRKRDSSGYLLLGIARREQRQYPQAIEAFNRAEALTPEPQLAELYDHRRRALMLMGNHEQALTDAEKCLSLAPGNYTYHINLLCSLVTSGRYEQAQAAYSEIGRQFWRPREAFVRRSFWTEVLSYVFDLMRAGQELKLPDNSATTAALLPFLEAKEIYGRVTARAQCVITDGYHPHWSPDGTKLTYSLGVLGASGVAVYDLRSRETKLLAVPGADSVYSPDGQFLAFVRDCPMLSLAQFSSAQPKQIQRPIKRKELWVMKADGTEPRRLALGSDPEWSPDSRSVFYFSQLDSRLYSISVVDPSPAPATVISGSRYDTWLSPDHKYGVYSAYHNMYLMALPSQEIVAQWLAPPERGRVVCSWLPADEALLAWDSYWLNFGLWRYDLRTHQATQILDGPFHHAMLSSQGQLAFVSREWPSSIWLTDLAVLTPGLTEQQYCQDAIKKYTRKIEADPEDLDSYYLRAQCYKFIHNTERATADWVAYERVLESSTGKTEGPPEPKDQGPVILTADRRDSRTSYAQTFDSIGPQGTTLPPGWKAGPYRSPQTGREAPWGPIRDAVLLVADGSADGTGVTCHFGGINNSDRAIGHIPDTKGGDRALQLALTNRTGKPIRRFTLGYAGEQWRDFGSEGYSVQKIRLYCSTRPGSDFAYMGPEFDFAAPQDQGLNLALDGNDPRNRQVIIATYTPQDPVVDGDTFYLTWHQRCVGGTKNHALAVDDVWLRIEE